MNAQALLSHFKTGHTQVKKPAKDFPPEAYDYDDPIDPVVVAAIQAESDMKLDKQEWTVVELITDDGHR
ncbi:MAG: hypothetical protein NT113_04330 [Hyphomicrobiales bacterium]|jgi:hypothetical protein|nr:hypothetical protein [Hyphomicrobiales bacterium]